MIPLYILGLLQRFGPQHGYQIKKIITEQLADFTRIKLPTIYYHLEKMKTEGLLEASNEKPGSRPEKTVYAVTETGKSAFLGMLEKLLHFDYHPVFPEDGIFYFSEYLDSEKIAKSLQSHIEDSQRVITYLKKHRDETMKIVPEESQSMVSIIFNHHLRHYQAELAWAKETITLLRPAN